MNEFIGTLGIGFPRMRGGDPHTNLIGIVSCGFSPHARG